MKNKITLLLLLISSFGAYAQAKGNIEFGIGTGYSTSNLDATANSNLNYDYRSSYNVSAFADFYINDRWSFRGRVFYDRKGYNNEQLTDADGFIFSTNVELNYITIPVTANWHFGRKRNWYLNFGPYVGFLAGVNETRFGVDLTDEFNNVDAGLAFGVGVKIPLNNKLRLFIEYDYQGGFADVFKNDIDYYGYYGSENNNYTTSRGAFNVGLNFLLK
ncbi:porin family protein [Flavobacterium sp. RHBU_24]|uniref:porin family protein n=1 Tax=Flavobacterium sp. RHBU_24 TaxID=3391185 RepID=UPI0039855970